MAEGKEIWKQEQEERGVRGLMGATRPLRFCTCVRLHPYPHGRRDTEYFTQAFGSPLSTLHGSLREIVN